MTVRKSQLTLWTALSVAVFVSAEASTKLNIASQASATDATDSATKRDDAPEVKEDTLPMDEAALRAAGITLSKVGAGTIETARDATGELKLNAEKTAVLMPRFGSLVKEVRKVIGQKVRRGEVLALMESNGNLATYSLTSPIDGTLIEKNVVVGQNVKDEVAAFVVADLATVWADLAVMSPDLPLVHVGQDVQIEIAANGKHFNSVVTYVAPVTSGVDRSAIVRAQLPNADGLLRPGLFVTGRLITNKMPVPIAIPTSALQLYEGSPCVFLWNGKGFTVRHVATGRSSDLL